MTVQECVRRQWADKLARCKFVRPLPSDKLTPCKFVRRRSVPNWDAVQIGLNAKLSAKLRQHHLHGTKLGAQVTDVLCVVRIIADGIATYRPMQPTSTYTSSSLFSLAAPLSVASSLTSSGTVVPIQVIQAFRAYLHTTRSWSNPAYVCRCSSDLRSRLRMAYAIFFVIARSTPTVRAHVMLQSKRKAGARKRSGNPSERRAQHAHADTLVSAAHETSWPSVPQTS